MSAKIYEPKGKAREYSPLALNYYKGCDHACKYCYVDPMMKRFDKDYKHEVVELREEIPAILKSIEASAKKYKDDGRQVLLNFTSDPYNRVETALELTRDVLKILLKYQIPTTILTKNPYFALRDLDLFKKFDNFSIGVSLTFYDLHKSKEWEPGAPPAVSLILPMRMFRSEKITTWASFEPVIDPDESLKLLDSVLHFSAVDFIKIGKLNNYKGIDKKINWTRFLTNAVGLMDNYGFTDFYIKKDLLAFKDPEIEFEAKQTDQDYFTLKRS